VGTDRPALAAIIGTAGHIDHGKTSLVKALTGIDTDRLKEEKQRGISIDLGFAHLDLPGGIRAGIVDVPGHERFIRNMLAGAHGIDLVLFTVAADDGVMPQTEEHLEIVDLLGVERAIFVVTKRDLVSPARLDEVGDEIEILIDGTALEGSPIVPVSSATGEGLEELKDRIVEGLASLTARRLDGYFRLPVDRAFPLRGHGLVVTGTAVSGQVAQGDRVRSQPRDVVFRVRGVQVHDEPVTHGVRGQRVALNLSSAEKAIVERGDVMCDERFVRTATMCDVHLRVRPGAGAGVRNHQRIRFYAGSTERMGKVSVLGVQRIVPPLQSSYCQITLVSPVHVLRGDRFVIRDETGQRTLGGGCVVHPWATRHKAKDADLQRRLEALHLGDVGRAAVAFVESSPEFAVGADDLGQFFNLRDEFLKPQLAAITALVLLDADGSLLYTTAERLAGLREAVRLQVERHHALHPMASGADVEEIRAALDWEVSPKLFRTIVDDLGASGVVVRDEHYLRLPDHTVRLDEADERLASAILAGLSAGPVSPMDLKQLEDLTGVSRDRLLQLLTLLERRGGLVRIGGDLYLSRAGVDAMKARVIEFLSSHKTITPAEFRDLFTTSRKYAIPLLEFLDRERVTLRVGEGRMLRNRT
jgi:selenocysteine-specific elongation factor